MFSPLTSSSSSSSSHPFVPYVDDPAKFLAMAQHELSFRYLQERLMSHVNMASTHNLFDHFPIVSPFIGGPNMASTNTALMHTSNPYPASTKLSSLQGKKQINSLFQTGSSTIFPTFNQYGGHQLSIMSQSINNQPKEFMGAFQVKNFSPSNHYYNPLTHLINLPHGKERTKKWGRWSIAHVRIAWEIHLDQQRKIHKEDKKEDVCNQSNASTNNDIWTSKKRKLKNESQSVDVCDDDDDDIDPGKRMCVKPTLEQPSFLSSSIENNSRTDNSLTFHRPHQSINHHSHQSINHHSLQSINHQSINHHSHSIHHMKKERDVLPNRKSLNRKTGSDSNTRAGDTLINLLKVSDVYTSLPGVVPTISDQSTDNANLFPR